MTKPPGRGLLPHVPQNRILRKQLQPAPNGSKTFIDATGLQLSDGEVFIKQVVVRRDDEALLEKVDAARVIARLREQLIEEQEVI